MESLKINVAPKNGEVEREVSYRYGGVEFLDERSGHGVSEIIEAQVKRVQGEDADRRIRIGIHPVVCGSGVIDRQDLDEFQTDPARPVGQRLEVREFAHPQAAVAAQGKNRNGHPGRPIESGRFPAVIFVVDHRPLARGELPFI